MHQTTREDCIRDLDTVITNACSGARLAADADSVAIWLGNAEKAWDLREALETESSIELAFAEAKAEDEAKEAAAKAEEAETDDEEPGPAVH